VDFNLTKIHQTEGNEKKCFSSSDPAKGKTKKSTRFEGPGEGTHVRTASGSNAEQRKSTTCHQSETKGKNAQKHKGNTKISKAQIC